MPGQRLQIRRRQHLSQDQHARADKRVTEHRPAATSTVAAVLTPTATSAPTEMASIKPTVTSKTAANTTSTNTPLPTSTATVEPTAIQTVVTVLTDAPANAQDVTENGNIESTGEVGITVGARSWRCSTAADWGGFEWRSGVDGSIRRRAHAGRSVLPSTTAATTMNRLSTQRHYGSI